MNTRTWLGPLLAAALLALPVGVAAQSGASLSVGNASGLPGAVSISVPVNLSSGGGAQIAGLSFTLTFDSSRLAFASCADGPSADAALKDAACNPQGASAVRVIIFGLNQNAIPDGTVVYVRFNVLSGATPGTSALTPSNLAATDPSGNPVTIGGSDGYFEVLAPPATNTLAPTATPTTSRTPSPTATSSGPTSTRTPTSTKTPTRTPGGPTNTLAPTSTVALATPTRTSTITRAPSESQTLTPVGTAASAMPSPAVAATQGSGEQAEATQTAQVATAVAEFEGAVAATATALADFEAAVRATATALAEGESPPPPGSGEIPPQLFSGALLWLGSGALAVVALGALIAFILLRRRQ